MSESCTPRRPAASPLTEAGRWALLAIILLCPWPWGCVLAPHREWLALALMGTTALCAAGWVQERRLPPWPRLLWVPIVFLLVIGWALGCNPKAFFDDALLLLMPVRAPVEWLPGTLDAASTRSWMRLFTGLAGALLVTADLTSSRPWRNRLWITLVLSGVAVAAFGLHQRIAGAPNIFWAPGKPANNTFFGPFVYHGNAGSFLLLPAILAVGRTVFSLQSASGGVAKLVWSLASLVLIAALAVNTSRGGLICGLAGIALFLLLVLPLWLKEMPSRTAIVAVIAALGGVAALGAAFGWDTTLSRISETDATDAAGRFRAAGAALPAAREAGFFGFGVGTFRMVFPHYQQLAGMSMENRWNQLHCDPVQALLEWGWTGTVAWTILLPGALVVGFRTRRDAPAGARQRQLLLTAAIAGFAALLLHSTVDFPLQIPAIMTHAAVVAGLLWGCRESTRATTTDAPPAPGGDNAAPILRRPGFTPRRRIASSP